jgi:hypothetical protein
MSFVVEASAARGGLDHTRPKLPPIGASRPGITAIDWKRRAGDKVGTTRGKENCCADNIV